MATIKNPIQFVSRTFTTILNDINSDSELIDKPNWFKRIWAGIGDVFSMWLNATGNNLVLRTSYTRQNVADLLELIDYYLAPADTSTGTLLFYLNTDVSFPITVSTEDLVAQSTGSLSVSSKIFEARSSSTVTEVTNTFATTDVDIDDDEITVDRDFLTGEKVMFSGSDLPAPLAEDTEYWVIRVSSTVIQVATSLTNAYAGTAIDITDIGSGTHAYTMYSFRATVYQQETQDTETIGTSDGVTEWQDFTLSKEDAIEDTIEITINSVTWEKVDSLVDSESTDTHYEVIYTTDNIAKIRFGNDTYGKIPDAFDIEADYAVGGGSNSNISVINKVSIYAGSDSNISGVSNPETLTGGDDAEDIESGKRLGPLLLKARNRFVTTDDGEALAEDYGGMSQVKVNSNVYGTLSAQVLAIANGGGNPSSSLQTELQEYLIERSVLESIDVRVEDTTFLTQNVVAGVKVLSGYSYDDLEPYVTIALKMFFSETGKEIKETYDYDSISSAVTLINTIFSTSFDSSDYTTLSAILDNLDYRQFGVDVQESDILGFVDSSITGIDYITISSPTLPISVDNDEITTDGTITLSELT